MNTNITKTWTIEIKEEEVLARCTNESLNQAYNRAEANTKGDIRVIQDDDKPILSMYFESAIAQLNMILARRMNNTPTFSNSIDYRIVTFDLQMHDNHDDNMETLLKIHCYDYVVKKILELWYHIEFGSELEKLEINHCLHFRKHPVHRRIGPLF